MKSSLSSWIISCCLAASLANASCDANPTKMTDFDATKFAGNWHMQATTRYGNDEWGCVKLSISEPDSSKEMDLSLRMVQLFSFNPMQVGAFRASDVSVEHSTNGELTEYRFWIPYNHYTILETDYTTYAIAYECSENVPQILNYLTDDIHIFTRSETVT